MITRTIDIFLSFIALILLSPLIFTTYILVKLTSVGPAIHWSKRIGRENNIFKMPKFRTMLVNTPQLATHLIDGQNYLTSIGSILRKSSLDELPQLWSVIKGDMSIVGPRPALFNQDDLKELRTKNNIHLIRPGVTGWAQINGRDEISIIEKVKFDKYYYANKSIFFDIKIIFLTILKVIMRKNVQH